MGKSLKLFQFFLKIHIILHTFAKLKTELFTEQLTKTINQHLIKLKKRFIYKLEFYGIESPSKRIERLIKNGKKVINPFITRHKYACLD
jgi:hypothetical protein